MNTKTFQVGTYFIINVWFSDKQVPYLFRVQPPTWIFFILIVFTEFEVIILQRLRCKSWDILYDMCSNKTGLGILSWHRIVTSLNCHLAFLVEYHEQTYRGIRLYFFSISIFSWYRLPTHFSRFFWMRLDTFFDDDNTLSGEALNDFCGELTGDFGFVFWVRSSAAASPMFIVPTRSVKSRCMWDLFRVTCMRYVFASQWVRNA